MFANSIILLSVYGSLYLFGGLGNNSHYRDNETRWDHAAEIRRHCGFRDFGDPGARVRLNRWLYALCWTGTDRPGVLFDRAYTWLITQKVLLLAVTTLERHVGDS